MSYLKERVFEKMGVSDEQNKIKIFCKGRHDDEQLKELDIFSSDDKDNIRILVYTLDRHLINYDHPNADPEHNNINNNREQTFYLTRLKEPKGDQKYIIPKGVGTFPFFPPMLIDKYEKGEEIKTLVLTEGYFKAFQGATHGWDIVGFSSIHHYADKKTKMLHPDISKLILKCKVKNVVMLYDGDCLNISTKAIEAKEDLAKRPNSFLSSMLKIHELLTPFDVKIYFSHVLSDEIKPNNPKGLDDLLIDQKGKEAEILEDFLMLSAPGQYFFKLNCSSFLKKLQPYFNLKNVEQFYTAWEEIIKDREFVYFGTTYKYNEQNKTLEKRVPRELKNFMRVGDEYYEKIKVPTIFEDETETIIVKRNKSTITDDFGKGALANIAKYKTFTNMPSHTNYQQVINNCYNKYAPFEHEAEQGDWSTIEFFLKHIFGEHYEYGLDYMQILYQYPTQILPILCLVSKERQTGKTTFLDFLKMIFGENCIKVGNSEISSQFNSYTATRLIVGVDETALDNNKEVTERIKMLSTSNRVPMQRKGVDHEEMWHFAKYILVSNNETNFIYTQEDEIRFWVRKVPRIERVITDLLKVMHEEIPAFLYFLNNRKIQTPKTSRAWFDHKLLETEALRKLKEKNKPVAEKEIRTFVHNLFVDFKMEEQLLTLEALKERVNLKKYEDTYLHNILRENLGLKKYERDGKETTTRFKVPRFNTSYNGDLEDKVTIVWEPYHGRPYVFRAIDFLTPEEMKELTITENEEIEDNQQKLPF